MDKQNGQTKTYNNGGANMENGKPAPDLKIFCVRCSSL